ncbi:nucleotidyltransferase family protein [Geomonas subterranea]|uniref:Nucleotidyltransferase domain-containing protein n=1 Tax=Geomonas subterranea TaxID=2847989 RepID=A0ABX8LC38_9BACT|nr:MULTISPECIES: nucleotidyltransferase domain-containing protein [Geomonas]QXE89585.1 nucleotidyltransferase domain-containing protein [Geomonas subterranea]QXM08298.1 nucleotidyltransferase domain-containing protein [Geomonas subterranea]
MPKLDLRPEWLEMVRQLLAVHLPDAEVLAYGSRVQGTSHDGSDLDLVARNVADLSVPQPNLFELKEALSDSNIPILVDILDWARIPESFRGEIERGGTVQVQSGKRR